MFIMIDLETFGTSSDAVIFQIGAVPFYMDELLKPREPEFNKYVDVDSCLRHGLKVSADAIHFWLRQNDYARRAVNEGSLRAMDLPSALMALSTFFNWTKVEGVWAKPTKFDMTILENAYEKCDLEIPWSRGKIYDVGTVFKLSGGRPQVQQLGVEHDAVDDCRQQIKELRVAMSRLGDEHGGKLKI